MRRVSLGSSANYLRRDGPITPIGHNVQIVAVIKGSALVCLVRAVSDATVSVDAVRPHL